MLSLSHDLCLSNWDHEILTMSFITHFICLTIKVLVLEENYYLLRSNRSFQETLVILSIVRTNCDEPWYV